MCDSFRFDWFTGPVRPVNAAALISPCAVKRSIKGALFGAVKPRNDPAYRYAGP